MPPVAFFAAAAATYATGNLTFLTPADVRRDDVLIVAVAGPSALTTSAPAGWELLGTINAGAPAARSALYRRVAVDAEPAQHVFAVGAVSPNPVGLLLLYRGLQPSAALAASAQQAVASVTTTHAAPAAVLVNYSDLVCVLQYAIDGAGTATLTAPAGTTKRAETHGASGAGGGSLAVCDVLPEAPGGYAVAAGTWSAAATGIAATYTLAAAATPVAPVVAVIVPGSIGLPAVGV